MTQHKVLSDDSMTAMDEIARVLGQDAVILSTKKIGEKIEIVGSNDIKDILKSNKKNQKKPNFKELFSNVPLSENKTDKKINSLIKNKNLISELKTNEVDIFLFVNYFGKRSRINSDLLEFINRKKITLIEDNTHCLTSFENLFDNSFNAKLKIRVDQPEPNSSIVVLLLINMY